MEIVRDLVTCAASLAAIAVLVPLARAICETAIEEIRERQRVRGYKEALSDVSTGLDDASRWFHDHPEAAGLLRALSRDQAARNVDEIRRNYERIKARMGND